MRIKKITAYIAAVMLAVLFAGAFAGCTGETVKTAYEPIDGTCDFLSIVQFNKYFIKMISDIENSLLVKYLKNELNEEESQKVIGWLEKNKENQIFFSVPLFFFS